MVLLGSSLGAALVTAGFQIWNSMRQGELQNIQDKLKWLYGPLFFFTRLNEDLINLCRRHEEACAKEYKDTRPTPENSEDLQQQVDQLFEEGNSYIEIDVIQNNEKIIPLLEKYWYLIDFDDVEIFSQFIIDMIMYKRIKGQTPRTALIIKKHIGPISFMRPEMIERVKEKFVSKIKREKQLTLGRRKIWGIIDRMLHFV
jgi:hypothetical protein